MSEKIISIRSGNEKFTMSVTEEDYEAWKGSVDCQHFFRQFL